MQNVRDDVMQYIRGSIEDLALIEGYTNVRLRLQSANTRDVISTISHYVGSNLKIFRFTESGVTFDFLRLAKPWVVNITTCEVAFTGSARKAFDVSAISPSLQQLVLLNSDVMLSRTQHWPTLESLRLYDGAGDNCKNMQRFVRKNPQIKELRFALSNGRIDQWNLMISLMPHLEKV